MTVSTPITKLTTKCKGKKIESKKQKQKQKQKQTRREEGKKGRREKRQGSLAAV